MGIRDLFRKRPEAPSRGQAVPDPVPVDMGDRQRQAGNFINYDGWDALNPAPPSWMIPERAEQMAWISSTITRHAGAGTLDEGVPDLLDREIHDQMAEIAKEVDSAHRTAIRVEHDLFEHAKDVQTQLLIQVRPLRQDLSRNEQGYRNAYEQLTGQRPDWAVEPQSIAPVLAPSITADALPPMDWDELDETAQGTTDAWVGSTPSSLHLTDGGPVSLTSSEDEGDHDAA